MSSFIGNILTRHLYPEASIMPRLPGKFEPVSAQATNGSENPAQETAADLPQFPVTRNESYEPGNNYSKISASETVTSMPLSNVQMHNKPVSHQTNSDQVNHNIQHAEGRDSEHPANIEKIHVVNTDINYPGQFDDTVFADDFQKQQLSFPVNAMPVQANTANDPALHKDLSIQGTTVTGLINDISKETVTKTENADLLNLNITMLRQKIKRKGPEKNGIVSETPNALTGNLIQPVIDQQPIANMPEAPAIFGEQTVNSVIKISIGRIDVRAVPASGPAKTGRTVPQKPNLTLDEYLKKRNGTGK